VSYEVRVRGRLGRSMRAAFPALDSDAQGDDTVLSGIADQAALHGVLAQIEALGLELLLVRRLPGGDRTPITQAGDAASPWRQPS
jgi:hypothetical protein